MKVNVSAHVAQNKMLKVIWNVRLSWEWSVHAFFLLSQTMIEYKQICGHLFISGRVREAEIGS